MRAEAFVKEAGKNICSLLSWSTFSLFCFGFNPLHLSAGTIYPRVPNILEALRL